MITVDQAKQLRHGQTIYEIGSYNADGTARRWRVSGKVQLWKTRPNDFRVPLKYGLYGHGDITHSTAKYFSIEEPPRRGKKNPFRTDKGKISSQYVIVHLPPPFDEEYDPDGIGFLATRHGKSTNRWGDGTIGVPKEVRELIEEADEAWDMDKNTMVYWNKK